MLPVERFLLAGQYGAVHPFRRREVPDQAQAHGEVVVAPRGAPAPLAVLDDVSPVVLLRDTQRHPVLAGDAQVGRESGGHGEGVPVVLAVRGVGP